MSIYLHESYVAELKVKLATSGSVVRYPTDCSTEPHFLNKTEVLVLLILTCKPCIAFPAASLVEKLTNAQYFSGKQRTLFTCPNLERE